jgi:hypothetical protein
VPKRIVWAMLKREKKEKKNIHATRHEKKMHAKEREEKKRRKERNKDSSYFQIRDTHPTRERFRIQRSIKIFRIRKL